jgi:hypothetical protein
VPQGILVWRAPKAIYCVDEDRWLLEQEFKSRGLAVARSQVQRRAVVIVAAKKTTHASQVHITHAKKVAAHL